jgi:hypothetical protein
MTSSIKHRKNKLGTVMVAHAYNHSTAGTVSGGLKIQGQTDLHRETLSKKNMEKISSDLSVSSFRVPFLYC